MLEPRARHEPKEPSSCMYGSTECGPTTNIRFGVVLNFSMIARVLARHRYMHDELPYRRLLEYAKALGPVWLATQRDVAHWWRMRNLARLKLEITGPNRLTISTELPNGVVEVGGGELHTLPYSISVSADARTDVKLPAPHSQQLVEFLEELLRHLGYAHVHIGNPGTSSQTLTDCLRDLYRHALQHQRYEPSLLKEVRKHIQDAHRAASLPDIRIWHWPANNKRAYRMALSVRFDVDKAIVNLPLIHSLEASFGLHSTVYLRPAGLFYGEREIRHYRLMNFPHEIALHGEFETTREILGSTSLAAANYEKERLESFIGQEVFGVCMHGGELRSNTTPETRLVVESAGFDYDTLFRNRYYLPLFIPTERGTRRTLSIGQHFADISVPIDTHFTHHLTQAFKEHCDAAFAEGGVFVPVMHPLYFGVGSYLRHPTNMRRILTFLPRYIQLTGRLRKDQSYVNP